MCVFVCVPGHTFFNVVRASTTNTQRLISVILTFTLLHIYSLLVPCVISLVKHYVLLYLHQKHVVNKV